MTPLWSGTGTFGNYENAAMRIVAKGEEIALEVALPGDSSYTETAGPIPGNSLNPPPNQHIFEQLLPRGLISLTSDSATAGGQSRR
jgi:hypothetical protein